MIIPASYYLILGGILFTIGVTGVLTRRNAVVILMSIELMLTAVNLTLVTFSNLHNSLEGQVLAFFVIVVTAAEVAVGIALVVAIFRAKNSMYVDEINLMKW